MAKLEIDNRVVHGRFGFYEGEMILPLDDMDDDTIRFFKQWKDQVETHKKVDVIKDIPVTTKMGDRVILKGVQPDPEICDENIRLIYDYREHIE